MSMETKQGIKQGKRPFNPLLKRVPKELISDWHKYLVIFLFLTLTIGFVSGMFVANYSMLQAIDAGYEEYNVEDGHFELDEPANASMLHSIERGTKVDLRAYAISKAHQEIERELEGEVTERAHEELEKQVKSMIPEAMYSDTLFKEMLKEAEDSEEYKEELADAIQEAKEEAIEEAEKKINETFDFEESKKTETQKQKEAEFYPVEITLYESFYKDTKEDIGADGVVDGKVRVYVNCEAINGACVMEGKIPKQEDEIAIDRMHAANNNIQVGDAIRIGGKPYTVCGLLSCVNYSTLYDKNTDSMFDALTFDVAWMTKEGYDKINAREHYGYAWKYGKTPKDENEEREWSDHVLAALITQSVKFDNAVEDYVPKYANNAIQFAPGDISGDEQKGGYMLYVLVVVLGFVFAITISSTIAKEASVIGTLRASGYTKGELIVHYMSMPMLVTLFAAVVGNILGYTVMKEVVVGMYYNSYSLPLYETVWYYGAFARTTVVPVILMLVINFIVVSYKLRLSPLKFLRHELKKTTRKKALKLPKISFFGRFRLRVMLQNLSNYIMLLIGIAFVMFLLAFCFIFPSTIKHYQDIAVDSMFARYQYVLKSTVDDDGMKILPGNRDAEKFSMTSLETVSGKRIGESILVYGLEPNSRYVNIGSELGKKEVYISKSYADKFNLKVGDDIELKEKYGSKTYELQVAGIYDYIGGLTVFMPLEEYNVLFDQPEYSFNGYLSNEELEISEKYIATSITEEDITKISRQLDHSMGSYMQYFKVVCFILAAILIYLLTKVIIEKNENAISMVKILGYEGREIASLYLVTTTWVVILSTLVTGFVGIKGIELLVIAILSGMDGWIPIYMGPWDLVFMNGLVIIAYLFVLIVDYRRIRKIPMDCALKNVE